MTLLNLITTYTQNWLVNTTRLFKVPMLFGAWALFLCACEEDDLRLGGDIPTGDERTVTRKLEIDLPASNFIVDSIRTNGGQRLNFGRLSDENFGELEVSSYFKLNLRTTNPDLEGGNPEITNFVLRIKPSYFLGSDTEATKLKIYELADDIDSDRNYYSFDSIAVGRELARTEVLVNAENTYVIEIPLNQDLANEWLSRAITDSNTFSSADNFRDYYKGFAIVSENENKLIGINTTDSAEVSLRYRLANDELKTITWGIDNIHFMHINQQGGIIPQDVAGYETFQLPDNAVMLHAGVGVKPKVSMAKLAEVLDTLGTIEVLRADFILNPKVNESNRISGLPTAFRLAATNDSNRTIIGLGGGAKAVQQEDRSQIQTGHAQQFLLSSNQVFRGQMTSYIQSIHTGVIDMPEYLMLEMSLQEFELSLNRFVVDNNDIKLVIYYTTLAD